MPQKMKLEQRQASGSDGIPPGGPHNSGDYASRPKSNTDPRTKAILIRIVELAFVGLVAAVTYWAIKSL